MASADQPPPVAGISELVLEVADMEASRAFYRDLLTEMRRSGRRSRPGSHAVEISAELLQLVA